MPHAITTTTMVRIAVARLELTPSIPIFANMDVSAANTADPNANQNHIPLHPRFHLTPSYVPTVLFLVL